MKRLKNIVGLVVSLAGLMLLAPAFVTASADASEIAEIKPATEVKANSATLNGVLNPLHAGETIIYGFYYDTEADECLGEGRVNTGEMEVMSLGPEPVEAKVTGLLPGTLYTACLYAYDEAGELHESALETFTTLTSPPEVSDVSFSTVGSSSAVVHAKVVAGGLATRYRIQYVSEAQFHANGYTQASELPAQGGELAASGAPLRIDQQLSGLQAATAYRFRVLASNQSGQVQSAEGAFTTLPLGLTTLPDARVFEMVTPAFNENSEVYVPFLGADHESSGASSIETGLPNVASADGNAVTYAGSPTAHGSGQSGGGSGNQYLAVRSSAGGWTATDIQPEGAAFPYYQGFSEDLTFGMLATCLREGPLAAGAPAGYEDLYTRISEDGSYHPLFTTIPANRAAAEFGTRGEFGFHAHTQCTFHGPRYAGASSDGEHKLLLANAQLTADAPPGGPQENNLYDVVAGRLSLVNVLPNGESESGAMFGAPHIENEAEDLEPGENPPDLEHDISSDGSHVFWTDMHTGADMERIFVRLNDAQPQSPLSGEDCLVPQDACTLAVSAGPARFWTATADGRYAFYTEASVLERFDAATNSRERLASGVVGVLGASSSNGGYVYFVTREGSAPDVHLFVWHDGTVTPIATLSARDGREVPPYIISNAGEFGDWQPSIAHRTAGVTPDGSHLLFMSSEQLTGHPTEQLAEVYLYDAAQGRLTCVSCSPSGEAPPRTLQVREGRAAAFLPVSEDETHLPRWISEDGSRVFFDSAVPLVAQDANGAIDVYEWERDGVGSCAESPGCVYLLSGATSSTNSLLIDASANGGDVFLATRAQLVPADRNENFDLYDVRVDGSTPAVAVACSGSGCQGAPPPSPIFATPSSYTFEGVGNLPPHSTGKPAARTLTRAQKLSKALKACRAKASRRKRAACEAQARKRYRPAGKAKQPSTKKGRI